MLEKMLDEDFDEINEIIEKSFPEHEIRGYEKQKKLLDNPNFHIYVMKDQKTALLKAFITVWDIEDFSFVDHFAVSHKFRNEGLGSEILKETRKTLNRRIFLEVDLPTNEISKRRIEFYKRNGFFENHFPYELPPLKEGEKPVAVMIMSSDDNLSQEKFNSLKKQLFKVVYDEN